MAQVKNNIQNDRQVDKHPVDGLVSLPPRVLIACEYSGRVREAFAAAGCDAMSCDLLDTELPGKHYKGDVKDLLDDDWDLMIGHPPCTYLANAGVQYLSDAERFVKMINATEFFNELLGEDLFSAAYDIKHIAIENPVQHKYARERIRKYDQIIQPYEHGESFSKRTCLWLKNLPKIKPTKIVDKGEFYKCGNGGTNPKWYSCDIKNRSRTFEGIAAAMAEQWTPILVRMKRSN